VGAFYPVGALQELPVWMARLQGAGSELDQDTWYMIQERVQDACERNICGDLWRHDSVACRKRAAACGCMQSCTAVECCIVQWE
jgi:hypothetical protein